MEENFAPCRSVVFVVLETFFKLFSFGDRVWRYVNCSVEYVAGFIAKRCAFLALRRNLGSVLVNGACGINDIVAVQNNAI